MELKSNFDKGVRARNTKEYESARYYIKKAKKRGDSEDFKTRIKMARKMPVMDYYDPRYKRLFYCRYADD